MAPEISILFIWIGLDIFVFEQGNILLYEFDLLTDLFEILLGPVFEIFQRQPDFPFKKAERTLFVLLDLVHEDSMV